MLSMESGAEVLRAVAAIVSTFQSAADTLEVVKDRREKKKRKKDKEVEELFELKMLHRSLVEVRIPSPSLELSNNDSSMTGWDEMPQTLREQTPAVWPCFRNWRCDRSTSA